MPRLTGVEISNFRSIGEKSLVLHPLKKCNVLIGPNNVGKSGALKAIQKILNRLTKKETDLEYTDRPGRNEEKPSTFTLHFDSTDQQDEVASLVGANEFDFTFSWKLGDQPILVDHSIARISEFDTANKLFRHATGSHWTVRVDSDQIHRTLLGLGAFFFERFLPSIPYVYFIPEFRQINAVQQPGGRIGYKTDGTDLPALLDSYQNPEIGRDQDKAKFNRIQNFLRRLLRTPEAELEVSHESRKIILTTNGLRLPLSSYGTGVHELTILLTAALNVDNSILCMEEPEIHLHPRLQREFMEFIINETTNQYLISTHSHTFINAFDQKDVRIFGLQLQGGVTVGGPIRGDDEGLRILQDLGVKASDLLQANCIIWAEGPSDRIYLRKWLELVAPELVEGKNHSIMFYGGRLLSHLSAERDDVPLELIPLLRINQNAVVIIDSDRKNSKGDINETKRRVKEECQQNGGMCWITAGREIENYLSSRVVRAVFKQLTGKEIAFVADPFMKFEQALGKALRDAGEKSHDYASGKLKYAKAFAQEYRLDDLSGELKRQLDEVAEKIRLWNS